MRRVGLVVAAVAIMAIAIGVTATGSSSETTPTATLTATGEGSVTFTPDKVSLTFGATSQRRTASGAVAANATVMNAILDAIKAAGATDVATNAVSLGPTYEPNGSTITGFSASNSVQGSAGVDLAPKLIDAAVGAGATNISGPSFGSIGDLEAMYRQALKAAVAQARARAAALAAAAGLSLGSLVSISSGSYGAQATGVPTGTAPAPSTPVVAPTEQVTASATVVYSIG